MSYKSLKKPKTVIYNANCSSKKTLKSYNKLKLNKIFRLKKLKYRIKK